MRNDLLKRLERLEQNRERSLAWHISIDPENTEINAKPKNRFYKPSQTGRDFHESDDFVRLVIGPYGSGKSTMCCHEIVRRACAMPIWFNGRRRSKWALIRNTSGELQSTTLQTWLQWFGELGDIRKRQKPILTYEHTFNDGYGVVELELIFIALDREEDVRKIKSLEITGVYINEMSEVPQAALAHLKGRVNHRYPSKAFCSEPYWSGVIADTNPPDVDHWIYTEFETQKPDSYHIFHQPPGLIKSSDGIWVGNPDADNASNLSPDYYTKLAEGQKEGFVKVYCLGEYGSVEYGKRVYPEFNYDIHSSDNLDAIQGDPIHLGWDFGLTPACIVFQFSDRGQLRVLKEYTSEDIGIRTFAKSIVIPALAKDFPYCRVGESEADPSGSNADTIMEELSCIGELCSLGIITQGASTNDIDPRIGAVRYFLNTMVDGQPAFKISRSGCPTLVKGFQRDYCYKRKKINGEESYKETPHKNYASHPHDALQYGCLRFASDYLIHNKAQKEEVDISNPVSQIFNMQGGYF